MKLSLLRDIYRIVVPQDPQMRAEWRGAVHSGPMKDVGSFVVLYDEAEATASAEDTQRDRGSSRKNEDDDETFNMPKSLLGTC